MKLTLRQLRSVIAEAAKPVPEYVAAGKFLNDAASQFQSLVGDFAAINARVNDLTNELVKFKESKTDHVLRNYIDEVLQKISRPGFVRLETLEADVKRLRRLAQSLNSAVR